MRRSMPMMMGVAALAPSGAALAAPAVAAAATHRYAGQVAAMRWGPVQVTVTVNGRRLSAISATYPTERSRSQSINTRAIPTLKSEALRAQSYRIHSLSGATLTSRAFANSLYSALHAAHLA